MANELRVTSFFNDPNLVAYYRLENTNDSRNSFNLTNNNGVSFNPGQFSNAADLGTSNTNKFLSVTNNLGVSGNCTLNLWAKVSTQPSNSQERLITLQNATTHDRHAITYIDTTGTKTINFSRTKQGVAAGSVDITSDLGTSAFHMVTLTYDGATVTGYLDGGSAQTFSQSGDGSSGLSDLLYLGMQEDGTSIPFSGLIDDVAIFTRALSAAEVAAIYAGYVAGGGFLLNLV